MAMTEDLSAQILRRKSFRSFRQEPLEEALMEDLIDFLSGLTPPAEDIEWNFDTLPYLDMMKLCSTGPGVKAPCYLLLRAERKRFSLQNCGYLGEMAALYLASRNVASCWQGSVIVQPGNDFPGSLPFVSALAIGYSDEEFRRDAAEFDRKPYDKVVFNREEAYRPILELGRLAPSSFNRQPCVFVTDDRQRIHLFRRRGFFSNPVSDFAQCVDAGAALAHLELGAKAAGYHPEIQRLRPEPKFKGKMVYQASLCLN